MKSNKNFWFGYIDTVKGKTLVVRNSLVDSNHKNTIFLYNSQRDTLVEYSREIIEPKLIPANEGEFEAAKLEKAYKRALREKRPNTYNLLYRTARMKSSPAASNDESELLDDDTDVDNNDDFNTNDFDRDSDD
jgi:hypothetical protein